MYTSGLVADVFCKNETGEIYKAIVWPGSCAFPDFTKSTAREWWGKLFEPLVDLGIAGFWNDMNEPTTFFAPTKTFPDTV
ncbi:hypothetical protein OFN94_32940, partial [Escherichia coli]|nr:hypothetical protein [Escherichia coli]